MASTKLVCVIGATGNQGGSVALRFAQDPQFRVRGLTRNSSSPSAQRLAAQGIEVVAADLDDPGSLEAAFLGANVIFSVTNYWEPFMRADCRQQAQQQGISCGKYAYNAEYTQGKNIVDAIVAAGAVETLDPNGFLVSTLSHAGKCSRGAFTELYHFDAKADVFPDYVQNKYPELAAKMSCIQTGYFTTSYRILPESYFSKLPDGSFQMRFPTAPEKPVPHLEVNADTGIFVYAVHQMPPGKHYMAEGSTCSWTNYMQLWSKVTGIPASYKQVSPEEMIAVTPDKETGRETADMYAYSSDPGYDGGMALLKAEDIRKAGIECPMTSLEEWMVKHDWSVVLGQ